MDRVEVFDVPNEGKDCLGRDRWVFLYFDHRGLMLDYYAHEERDSKRQKFRARREYNRLSHNRSMDRTIERLTDDTVPLPDWVKERAKELFMASIEVGKWGR